MAKALSGRWKIKAIESEGEDFAVLWDCPCGMDHVERFTLPMVYSDRKVMDSVTLQFCVAMLDAELHRHIDARMEPVCH